jgi:uncharacterized protein YbbC (DUF1343 family)
VDGPVLPAKFKSFIGMQPIPIVYGMTIAECSNGFGKDACNKYNLSIININMLADKEHSYTANPSPKFSVRNNYLCIRP